MQQMSGITEKLRNIYAKNWKQPETGLTACPLHLTLLRAIAVEMGDCRLISNRGIDCFSNNFVN